MTEQELHAAQDAAFIEYFHSVERRQLRDKSKGCTLSLRTAESFAFRKGWAAADAFADEHSEPEQISHIPDTAKMVRLTTATQIMAGLLASDRPTRHPVKRAIELTDALLAELDKTKEND